MAKWHYKIQLNEVLEQASEDFDLSCFEKKCPKSVKTKLAAEVEKAPPLARFGARILRAVSIAEVNRVLSEVFDEADRSRVWCGGI